MIASHYAEPLSRVVGAATKLRAGPAEAAAEIERLAAGTPFDLLDDSLGWSWGYAGKERRVGYVRSNALSAG